MKTEIKRKFTESALSGNSRRVSMKRQRGEERKAFKVKHQTFIFIDVTFESY